MKERRSDRTANVFIGVCLALGCLSGSTLAHPLHVAGASDYPFQALDVISFHESGDPLSDWRPARTWTANNGKSLQAELLSVDGHQVQLKLRSGNKAKILIDKLSEADQRFIAEWQEISRFFNASYRPPKDLTGQVRAEMFDGLFAKEGKVHQTRHFKFECDEPLRAEIAKDFSRLFEATYAAVESCPLALRLHRPDGGRFVVRLFADEAGYFAVGGSMEAAGVYLVDKREILVPLKSLGIERGANGKFRAARDYDPATLIHETVHAITHQWLSPMPLWFSEGLAEYFAAIPYRDGVLDLRSHREGLKSRAAKKFGGDATAFELFAPDEFIHLSKPRFMGQLVAGEQDIRLKPVEPFQIELAPAAAAEKPQVAVVQGIAPPKIPRLKPPFAKPDPTVTRRYVSSMLLVHHLIENDPESVRKYLFALLHAEWSRKHYVDTWNGRLEEHTEAVEAQIEEFKRELAAFRTYVDTFNDAVTRHNAGEVVKVPPRPVQPVPPPAVPVPEMLAKPKKPSELSRSGDERSILESHLSVPPSLAVPE